MTNKLKSCFPSRDGSSRVAAKAGFAAPWWTPVLASQRSRVRALRRRFQKESDAERRSEKRVIFSRALANYKKCILRAKRASWRRYLHGITSSDPLKHWEYLITDKNGGRLKHNVVDPVLGPADGVAESARVLLRYHFPRIVDEFPDFSHLEFGAPLILQTEVDLAFFESRRDGAPGPDGILLNVWREVFNINPTLLVNIFNSCLVMGYFPRTWRRARVVFFEKQGKNLSLPSSYRPICLLDTLGKLFERILANRINFFLSRYDLLSSRQYGFVRGLSAVHAIDRVCDFIGESRSTYHVSLIALDFKNAFNSLKWSLVVGEMVRIGIPGYLVRTVRSYFGSRSVFSDLAADSEIEYNVGAPQGSILAPLAWNMVLNPLLDTELDMDSDCDIIAYADDVLIMIRGTSTPNIAARANSILDKVTVWCSRNSLTLDTEKTMQMFFPKTGRSASSPPPRITLNGRVLKRSYNLKYLGVSFDTNLAWTFHLNSLYDKTQVIYHKLLRITGKTWGLNPNVRKKLYLAKIAPMLLYACQVWWRWGRGEKMKTLLDKIQRPFLLVITRSFRTVSTAALQVMAGVPPIHLMADLRATIFGVAMGYEASFGSVEIEPAVVEPCLCRSYLDPQGLGRISWRTFGLHRADIYIFTDGSGMRGRVGAGFAAFLSPSSPPLYVQSIRLSDHASVFQAEIQAIFLAAQWCSYMRGMSFAIISDSRSALDAICSWHPSTKLIADTRTLINTFDKNMNLYWTRSHVGTRGNELADTLAKSAIDLENIGCHVGMSIARVKSLLWRELMLRWNAMWHASTDGRPVFEIWRDVGLEIRIGDFYLAQLATNHGKFPVFFNRFWNRSCSCRCGCVGADRSHYIFDCPLLGEIRQFALPAVVKGCRELRTLFDFKSTSRGLRCIMQYIVSHEESLLIG